MSRANRKAVRTDRVSRDARPHRGATCRGYAGPDAVADEVHSGCFCQTGQRGTQHCPWQRKVYARGGDRNRRASRAAGHSTRASSLCGVVIWAGSDRVRPTSWHSRVRRSSRTPRGLEFGTNTHNAMIEDRETGARVRCIGSDPARAAGLAPSIVLADEPASWPRARSDRMRAVLRTSLGKAAGFSVARSRDTIV